MKRLFLAAHIACSMALPSAGSAAQPAPAKVVVLARQKTITLERALIDGQKLWVPQDRVESITGFELKPQGLCAGEICIPMPADGSWLMQSDGVTYLQVTLFAEKVGQVFAVDPEQHVWSFTAVPKAPTAPLMDGLAPDFALPDRTGKLLRLSDFRGKKVLLLTWASWCACRHDLAGWEPLYQELKGKGFEVIAVAQDTAGSQVTEKWYEKANVTYTTLNDTQHIVSSLYQMINVPSGVWIDETGHLVRSAEVAYSKRQTVLGQPIGDDRYAAGLRDWVQKGAASIYVVSADKLRARLAMRTPAERLAEAEFKLGVYFSEQGNRELATRHWQAAQRLSPDNWNYHRQDWSFDKSTESVNWFAKFKQLGNKPYYEPVEFPAAASPPKEERGGK